MESALPRVLTVIESPETGPKAQLPQEPQNSRQTLSLQCCCLLSPRILSPAALRLRHPAQNKVPPLLESRTSQCHGQKQSLGPKLDTVKFRKPAVATCEAKRKQKATFNPSLVNQWGLGPRPPCTFTRNVAVPCAPGGLVAAVGGRGGVVLSVSPGPLCSWATQRLGVLWMLGVQFVHMQVSIQSMSVFPTVLCGAKKAL